MTADPRDAYVDRTVTLTGRAESALWSIAAAEGLSFDEAVNRAVQVYAALRGAERGRPYRLLRPDDSVEVRFLTLPRDDAP